MKKNLVIISFLLMCFGQLSMAQDREVFFQNLREEAGLDYHLINDIDQDSFGRLWLATYNGVYLYDGNSFKNILIDPQKKYHITSNLCNSLSVDSKDNLWLGTDDQGLNILISELDSIIQISDTLLSHGGQISSKILDIETTSNQIGYILTRLGLFEISGLDKMMIRSKFIPLASPIIAKDVRCLKFHPDGKIFVGTKNGLLVWDQSLEEWIQKDDGFTFIKGNISSIDIDQEGQIWIGVKDKNGIYTIDPTTLTVSPYPFVDDMSGANRVHLCHDKDQYLWVVSGRQGVYRHNLKSKKNEFFEGKDYDLKPGNFTNFTSNPLKDKFGNIWFCGGGLHKWSNTGKRFFHYQNPLGDYQASAAIYDDKDYRIQSLWGNGLVVWNKLNDTYVRIDEKQGLLSKTMYSIDQFGKNTYLICGTGGCQILDAKNAQVLETIPIKGTAYDIKKDKNHWLIAGSRGLWSLSDSKNVKQLLKIKDQRGLAIDSSRNIWIATINNGMFHWNRMNDEISHFVNEPDEKNSLLGNRIEDIDIGHNGFIWLATSAGIEKYDPIKNEWTNFMSDKKLANIRANSVLCLNKTLVWVSNNNYISRYEIATDTWTHFNEEDGILNPYFYERAAYLNKDGELFFAGRKGITHFTSNEIKYNEVEPNLYFENIKIDGKNFPYDDSSIRMNWKNRFIEFNFSGVHLTSPKSLIYAYRLLPIQKEWIPIPKQPIYFSNLGSGDYRLEVSVKTKDGMKSKNTLNAQISVVPPIWRRWYFWLVAFIISSTAIIIWNQKRINVIRRKVNLDQKLMELEQVALQSQMNPHFIFNAMSGIQYFIIEQDESRAMKYLSILGKLIRKILDYSNRKWITLIEEIELIQHYADLEKLRFSQSVEIDIQYQLEHSDIEIYIPPLLLQPIVENAFTHGLRHVNKQQRKIIIEFNIVDEKILQLIVKDNGIGRKAAENKKDSFHKSKGSQNVQKRLQLVGEQLGVETKYRTIDLYSPTNEAAGTKVELHIPYKRDNI